MLSGDVHYASDADPRLLGQGPAASPSRLVQCTSSPAKNVFKDVVDQIVRQVGEPAARRGGAARAARVEEDRRRRPRAVRAPGCRWRGRRDSDVSLLCSPTGGGPRTRVDPREQAAGLALAVQPVVDTTTTLPRRSLRPALDRRRQLTRSTTERLTTIAAAHRTPARRREAAAAAARLRSRTSGPCSSFSADGAGVDGDPHDLHRRRAPACAPAAADTGRSPPGGSPRQTVTLRRRTPCTALRCATPATDKPPTINGGGLRWPTSPSTRSSP